tara:strand:+ start:209 stop:511 length:303 start_codon:yes stop_codon:yes gene_type:complete
VGSGTTGGILGREGSGITGGSPGKVGSGIIGLIFGILSSLSIDKKSSLGDLSGSLSIGGLGEACIGSPGKVGSGTTLLIGSPIGAIIDLLSNRIILYLFH